MIHRVDITPKALKTLKRLPRYIVESLMSWIEDVEHSGLEEARKRSGYHDEPLLGARQGERSIRLSRSYRAIYILTRSGTVKIALVTEVHKHDY